ncbi:hypothetical protein OEZ85_013187 [Tetradesmus obliquus]|uniref:Plastocyanin-like domain-containing protein n=1 Tax=Tetradesmus obliquus TaxID=3088 RepID=A0ABY8U4X5_TETOB|nr:hypothetical protein OEZ85_013187 [Tetradesmus obliquus]
MQDGDKRRCPQTGARIAGLAARSLAADPNPDFDEYIISVRQILQAVLPITKSANAPPDCAEYDPSKQTRVFAYGADIDGKATHNWPAYTIKATRGRPVQVRWVNELVDGNRRYRPHLFADQLDQTLHCIAATTKYTGPVPIVTHVHGNEGVQDNSDGYTEAWYLPDAVNLAGYTPVGTWYNIFKQQAQASYPASGFGPGYATYTYATKQRATQLWYHDHTLGATRLNVYAGMAGFFMLRDSFPDNKPELPGLPFPPPGKGPDSAVRELLLAIQDRAFDVNNQLYYPKKQGVKPEDILPKGPVPPLWVPEFQVETDDGMDATMMTVNGRVSPRHDVVREPYRLRVLNGCNAKALILYFSTTQPTAATPVVTTGILPFYAIGNEGGFFPSVVGPITDTGVLMGPAERYDLIIDFSALKAGAQVHMLNKGPGGPYDGSNAGDGLTVHTAQVMRFDVTAAAPANGPFDAAKRAALNASLRADYNKALSALPAATVKRQFTLMEEFESDHPVAQYLGTVDASNTNAQKGLEQHWSAPVLFSSGTNATEEWTMINLTPDAHPIHIHEVFFEVVGYEKVDIDEQGRFKFTGQLGLPPSLLPGQIIAAACDAGQCRVRKDTMLMPPGYATTVRMRTANRPGLFVWHCHLLEHEDNEMMRPWCVGNPGYTNPETGKPMCPPPP